MSQHLGLSRRHVLGMGTAVALAGLLDPAVARAQPSRGTVSVRLATTRDSIIVTHDDGFQQIIPVRLAALDFTGATFRNVAPTAVGQDGNTFTYSYPALRVGDANVRPTLTVDAEPRGPVRCYLDLTVDAGPVTLEKVTILEFDAAEPVTQYRPDEWQSWPLLGDHFFYGVEFPVATATSTSGTVSLGYMPGKHLQDGETFRSHRVVVAPVAEKAPRQAFAEYFWALRARPTANHVNYNPWWTMGFPYAESDCLGIIDRILPDGDTSGPRYDSVAFDMGWSAAEAIWQPDPQRFPNGFARVSEALVARGVGLGLWWSPSNMYTPLSFDNEWAANHGYETFIPAGGTSRFACLAAGTRYQRKTLTSLRDIARTTAFAHLKADGYTPECPAPDHGHLPGELSRDAIAAGIIEIFGMLRTERPEVWIEATCMGAGSPWWLLWADTTIGGFGDDAPFGVVPSATYRDSYTSARDFHVLNGRRLNAVTPIPAQEALGIVHQTTDPPYDDAVVAALRGHAFLPLYVNPGRTTRHEHAFFGELTRWFQANADQLFETVPIFPSSWPPGALNPEQSMQMRTPYGFAHPAGQRTVVVLRNPWIETSTVVVPPDALPAGQVSVLQLYPHPRGVARNVAAGDGLAVTLSGYETKVLAIEKGHAGVAITPDPAVAALDGLNHATGTLSGVVNGFSATVDADVDGTGWELHLLFEKLTDFDLTALTVKDGTHSIETSVVDSAAGWSAAQPWIEFNNWKYVTAQLGAGQHEISVEASVSPGVVQISGWIVRRLLIESDPKTDQYVRQAFKFPVPIFPSIMVARKLFDGETARPAGESLAVGRPSRQSSTAGGVAGLANDGNTDGDYFHGSVSHTGLDVNAWWEVDLGRSYNIGEIDVWNRSDSPGAAERVKDYYVMVSDTPLPTDLSEALQEPGVWTVRSPDTAGLPSKFPTGGVPGRYVRIQLAGTNYLHLAEVQVFEALPQ